MHECTKVFAQRVDLLQELESAGKHYTRALLRIVHRLPRIIAVIKFRVFFARFRCSA